MSIDRGRMTVHPEICLGKLAVRGLRYPEEMIRELLDSGVSDDEILADHSDLERDGLRAVLEHRPG